MSRKVTQKEIRVHIHCACGYNEVDYSYDFISYRHFKIMDIRRRKCKKTGEYFLSRELNFDNCSNCMTITF